MPSPTDEALMLSYQEGDASAFDLLYERYGKRVYGYLKKRLPQPQDRDEAFQAVFLKLHRTRAQYNPKFSFAQWIFTISRTTSIDALRKQIPASARTTEINPDTVAASMPAESKSDFSSLGLKAEDNDLLERRLNDDQSFDEISRHLGLTPAATRQRWSRLMKKLAEKLQP